MGARIASLILRVFLEEFVARLSLKIHIIHVRTAFEARQALAKVLEEIGKL
jgi:hypothetical protein